MCAYLFTVRWQDSSGYLKQDDTGRGTQERNQDTGKALQLEHLRDMGRWVVRDGRRKFWLSLRGNRQPAVIPLRGRDWVQRRVTLGDRLERHCYDLAGYNGTICGG